MRKAEATNLTGQNPDNWFMFEMSKVQYALPELKLLADRLSNVVDKVDAAVDLNSLICLRSAKLDLDDIVRDFATQLPAMRDTLEIIITKASRSNP